MLSQFTTGDLITLCGLFGAFVAFYAKLYAEIKVNTTITRQTSHRVDELEKMVKEVARLFKLNGERK